MDSKLYRELLEAYMNVYASEDVLDEAKHEGEKEEEEDTKKKSSKKGEDEEEDEDEMEEMDEAVENLDEISADLGLRASKEADKKRAKLAHAGDKAGAAEKAAQASRLYKAQAKKRLNREEVDVFDEVIEFLCVEGYAETLEEAEWMMANVIDEEAIDIILGEAEGSYGKTPKATAAYGKLATARRNKPASEYSQKGEKTKKVKSAEKHFSSSMKTAAQHRGKQSTPPSRMVGRGKLDQDSRDYSREDDVEYGDGSNKPGSGTVTKNPKKLRKQKALGELGESQQARNNPEKYEREQSKKYAHVRGEKTPMPPRGDKRREDFEKWYRANVR